VSTDRMRRVNEAVREVLSSRISGGFNDPRIGFVTVTAVDTSPDLRHARVHVSVLGDQDERERTFFSLTKNSMMSPTFTSWKPSMVRPHS